MKKPDIHRLIAFEELLLRFRTIERMIPLPFSSQENENDAEHSYALAMTAWFLAPHFPHLDRDEVIRMALAHDLVELYAGDTFA
jgi:putative hydrolase of HD superfamily